MRCNGACHDSFLSLLCVSLPLPCRSFFFPPTAHKGSKSSQARLSPALPGRRRTTNPFVLRLGVFFSLRSCLVATGFPSSELSIFFLGCQLVSRAVLCRRVPCPGAPGARCHRGTTESEECHPNASPTRPPLSRLQCVCAIYVEPRAVRLTSSSRFLGAMRTADVRLVGCWCSYPAGGLTECTNFAEDVVDHCQRCR